MCISYTDLYDHNIADGDLDRVLQSHSPNHERGGNAELTVHQSTQYGNYLAESGGNEGEREAVYLTPVMIYVPHTSNDYVGGIHVFNVHLTGFFLFLFFCIKHNQTGVYKKI